MVSADQLGQIMPTLPAPKLNEYLPFLQQAMSEFKITSYLREAAFLAQIAEESVELRFFEEIADGTEYEGRADLGNVNRGDGPRYKGRGPIQLTGRHNYREAGQTLGLPLEAQPELAAQADVGFRTAGLYWANHGCNELADESDFTQITRRINGGLNGLAERQDYYQHALLVLDKGDTVEGPAPKLEVDGKPVDASGFSKNGVTMVALRPVCEAANWIIVSAQAGQAVVRTRDGVNHAVPLLIRNGVGFAVLRQLPGIVDFDAKENLASLQTAGATTRSLVPA